MKKLLTLGAALAAAMSLAACNTVAGANTALTSFNDNLLKLASDPNCGHNDEVNVVLGAVPSGTINIKRQCAAAGVSAQAGTAQ
jgi:hypothetical protein